MAVIEINGVELEIDILDADVMAKYESLNQELLEKVQGNDYSSMKTSEGMIYQCRCIDRFFDKLFGDGTAEAVFGENNNLSKRLEGYGAVTTKANETARDQISDLTNKYSPNRIERRQQQKYTNKPKHKNRKFYA